jgi:N-glycosidase YbiA
MEKHEPLVIRLEFTTEESAALLAASSHYVMYAKRHPELGLQETALLLEDLQRKLVEQARAVCISVDATRFEGGAAMTEETAPILFYEIEGSYGCFSNFAPFGITLDGLWWPTTEHYFQAQKFAGTPYAEKIRQASTPKQAAELGRDPIFPLRPDWERIKDEVMYRAVLRKIWLYPSLHSILLDTGDRLIVENNHEDDYWGCGKDEQGKNRLGYILMQVRAHFREQEAVKGNP